MDRRPAFCERPETPPLPFSVRRCTARVRLSEDAAGRVRDLRRTTRKRPERMEWINGAWVRTPCFLRWRRRWNDVSKKALSGLDLAEFQGPVSRANSSAGCNVGHDCRAQLASSVVQPN